MNSRAAFWSILIFGGARVLGWLRVGEELELKGMDIDKHGEAAYPAQVTFRVSNTIASPVVLSQLKQLTIKTYNLGNSKMCFTIFAASLLTEILKNLSRSQFNK